MPSWLVQWGAAGAVCFVVWLFMKSNEEWGKSRDAERTAAAEERKEERKAFECILREQRADLLKALEENAKTVQRMIENCTQRGPDYDIPAGRSAGVNHKRDAA